MGGGGVEGNEDYLRRKYIRVKKVFDEGNFYFS